MTEAMMEASTTLRNLSTLERRILDAARIGINEVVKIAYRSTQDTTLFKDRTTELRKTIDIVDTGAFSKRLTTRARHARFVELGTRPHVIRPRYAPMLAFQIAGVWVRTMKVNHPGTAARPFMRNAAMAGSQAMRIIMDQRVAEAVELP